MAGEHKYAIKGQTTVLTKSHREYTHAVVYFERKAAVNNPKWVRMHACGSYELAVKAKETHRGRSYYDILEIVELVKL